MNQGYFSSELSNIFQLLKSKSIPIQDQAAKQLALFISRNRNSSEDMIPKISQVFNSSNEIGDRVMIKVIQNVIQVLTNSNNQMINFLNIIFPLLFHIVFYANRNPEEFRIITKMIGNLVIVGGNHTCQIIESNIDSLFDKFNSESNFKFEYRKVALLYLLQEYMKTASVIVYNKIIENFDLFLKILDNYKDSKHSIREATQGVLEEFLILLNERDCKYYSIS